LRRGRSAALWALLLAAIGCSERLEVLSGLADAGERPAPPPPAAGSDASIACSDCAPDDICMNGTCQAPPPNTIGALALGVQHTCAISSGHLYCWGNNDNGQLGTGDNIEHNTPTGVGDATDWITVAAGSRHSCGLRAPGSLYCWGDNSQSQLGVGTNRARSRTPTMIAGNDDYTELHCGGDNCCARRSNGELDCWGANAEGSAGSAGVTRTITMSGGSGGNPPSTISITVVPVPTPVASDSTFAAQFDVGGAHTCAIRNDRALLCWGRNMEGQLGLGRMGTAQRMPVEVSASRDWATVATGFHHTCATLRDGSLACWGENGDAQLGIGRTQPDGTPLRADMPIAIDMSTDWSAVAAGGAHTCGLKTGHDLLCWGRGTSGQLGVGTSPDVLEMPTLVSPSGVWRLVELGTLHSCGIDRASQLYCWGDNGQGQLGLGDQTPRQQPTLLQL
jgi:alpha-tubulin suppressor-like RCC1 family protein